MLFSVSVEDFIVVLVDVDDAARTEEELSAFSWEGVLGNEFFDTNSDFGLLVDILLSKELSLYRKVF